MDSVMKRRKGGRGTEEKLWGVRMMKRERWANYKSNPVCDADIVQCIGESGKIPLDLKSSQTPIIRITNTNGNGSVGGVWLLFFRAPLRWCGKAWRCGYGMWSESRETMLGIATPPWRPVGIPRTLAFSFAHTSKSTITMWDRIYVFSVLVFLRRRWGWVWEEG